MPVREGERVFTYQCTFDLSGTMPPNGSCQDLRKNIVNFWLRVGGGPQWTLVQWNKWQCSPGGSITCNFTSQRYSNIQRGRDARWAWGELSAIIDKLQITNYTLKVWMMQLSTNEGSFN